MYPTRLLSLSSPLPRSPPTPSPSKNLPKYAPNPSKTPIRDLDSSSSLRPSTTKPSPLLNSTTGPSTTDSGEREKGLVWAGRSGKMGPSIKATGPRTWPTDRAASSRQEGMSTRESGSTTKLREGESTSTKTAPHTQASGTTTSSTGMATRNGEMERSTKETTLRV